MAFSLHSYPVSAAKPRTNPGAADIGATMSENTNDLQARIAELEAEKAKLEKKVKNATRVQISEKGCVSLYGVRRFPVSFYPSEWEVIFGAKEDIESFIEKNAEKLQAKADAKKAAQQDAKEARAKEKQAAKAQKAGANELSPEIINKANELVAKGITSDYNAAIKSAKMMVG